MKFKKVVIAGYGYLGHKLGRHLLNQGYSVTAIKRHIDSIEPVANLTALSIDLDSPAGEIYLANEVYALIYLIPPNSNNGNCDDKRLEQFLSTLSKPPARIIYISTTGVYGDCQGEWIDEKRPVNPSNNRSVWRVSAEQKITSYSQLMNLDYMILRVSGIYGPKRLPLQRIIDRTAVLCPEASPFSNRIHVEDLSRVCLASLLSSSKNEVINVADGHPSSMTDFIYTVADLAGLERPPCVSESEAKKILSDSMLSYLSESRKINNAKMLKLLNEPLKYADLKTGIIDSLSTRKA